MGSSITGGSNTALGATAMQNLTSGTNNVAIGKESGYNVTVGTYNVAIGYKAGRGVTTTGDTIYIGKEAGSNATGYRNIGIGQITLQNSTSSNNIGIGQLAGRYLTSGGSNSSVGYRAGDSTTTGSNNQSFGYMASSTSATASNEFTLGDTSISNLRCNDTSISSLSDQRDKAEITDLPEEAGLSLINSLRPVTYFWDRREWYDDGVTDGSKINRNYKMWKANSGLRQGFIAQEVETAITGIKCLEDSQIVNGTVDKKEFAPAHLLTNAIKAIQQLSAENKALMTRIEALENA
jgi:hypothetical protein